MCRSRAEGFDIDAEGKVVVLGDPMPDQYENVRNAAIARPAFAIELDES